MQVAELSRGSWIERAENVILARSLVEARDARELGRMHHRLHGVGLLIVDELASTASNRDERRR